MPESSSPTASSSGSPSLTALRQRRALSQSQLSALSGVAIRTVRNLERGGSSRPRPATVQRVLDVLDSDATTRTAIIGELDLVVDNGLLEPRRLFGESASLDALARDIEPLLRRYRTVYYGRHATVRDRRITEERFSTVIVATEPRVSRLSGVIDTGSEDAARRLQVAASDGCRLVSAQAVDGTDLVLVTLDLPSPITEGGAHAYAITYSDPLAPARDDGSLFVGLHKSIPVAVLQVGFESGDLPMRCRRASRDTSADPADLGDAIDVSPSGDATRAWSDPTPGWHGIAWDWTGDVRQRTPSTSLSR